MSKTLFPVINPYTQKLVYYKSRKLVHLSGDWHVAIQANIIRKNKSGSFDILMQKRSSRVDIGKDKFDQSLATQMIKDDKFISENTLRRGLLQELGISSFEFIKLRGLFYINKSYKEQPEIKNRELLKFYVVLIDSEELLKANKNKIDQIEWVEWSVFKKLIFEKRKAFTKTSQFYFLNPKMVNIIENASRDLIHKKAKLEYGINEIIYHIDTPEVFKSVYLDKRDLKNYKEFFV